ncbi:MAG: hypothetical protein L3J51_12250 [Cocleimonas sp.]|nr:hypothetical protein [Cocleimonas sp.]
MRIQLALRNLYISQAIILAFLVFAYFIWFPHSFSKLGGFSETALMLIFVDLVLGPLLVLIVYKEGKKFLRFDINVLLAIQLFAFAFGAYSLFLKHPAYVVFTVDRFTLANVSQLYPQQPWLTQFKSSFFSSPQFVVAKSPSNTKERNALMFNVLLKGEPDINERPELFEPLAQHVDAVFAKSIPLDLLFQNNKTKEKFTAFYKLYGGKASDYAYFPLVGNNKKDMIWVFDRITTKPVGIIDSDPWLVAKK